MIDPNAFDDLIAEVARLNGLDLDTAGDAVAITGDRLEIDEETGLVSVQMDDGRTLLLKWPKDEDDGE